MLQSEAEIAGATTNLSGKMSNSCLTRIESAIWELLKRLDTSIKVENGVAEIGMLKPKSSSDSLNYIWAKDEPKMSTEEAKKNKLKQEIELKKAEEKALMNFKLGIADDLIKGC